MDVTATRLKNGDLRLTVDAETRQEIMDAMEDGKGFWPIICDLFESYSCNGSYTPFDASDANPFVGLTSAPCIAECMDVEDDGTCNVQGDFWYFANYAITDPLDDLAATGEATFTLARE